MLKIYNSLTRRVAHFEPISDEHIKLYVCGVTVYDYCHLGHARVFVAFDVVVRFLRAMGYQVTYVRNITDIDDKIIQRALQNKETCSTLTERFIAEMRADSDALGIIPPDHEPKATESLPQIIAMIQTLLDKKIAYLGDNGDVYYAVQQFSNYGKLSNRQLDSLQVGARVEANENKTNPLDFVLWKQAKPNEPSWPSPWGAGRPGWHIECSAMSTHWLGNHFDIHGGGADLLFPHHENEIAQSEAATGCCFVNTWMHVGFVQVNQQKMSKSLHNFFTVRDLLAHHHPEAVRYFLVSSHYRSPLNYDEDSLTMAHHSLKRLYQTLSSVTEPLPEAPVECPYQAKFIEAMCNDFNTPDALAVLFELSHLINKTENNNEKRIYAASLKTIGSWLGLLQSAPQSFLQAGLTTEGCNVETIDKAIAERNLARQQKDWAKADAIRNALLDQGIVLEDKNDLTTWHRQIR